MKKLILFLLIFFWSTGAWATYPNYTVMPSGGDFNTLQGAVADLIASHSGSTTAVTITISGTWASADTTQVNITSVSAASITISTTGSSRHPGYFSNASPYYRLICNINTDACLKVGSSNVGIIGLQVENTNTTSGYTAAVFTNQTTTINWDSNIFITKSTDTGISSGAYHNNVDNGITQINTIFIGAGNGVSQPEGYGGSTRHTYLNCVFIGTAGYGIYASQAGNYGAIIKNSYAFGGTTAYNLLGSSNTLTTDFSNDGSKSTTTAAYSISSGAKFTNVTSGSENFTLLTGSTLIGAGTDLSGTFTDDITGATRTVPWDVGAFKYTGAAPTNHGFTRFLK